MSKPRTQPRTISSLTLTMLLTMTVGCDAEPTDDTSTHDTDTPSSSDLLLDLQVEVSSEVPTVARVLWETTEPTTGWVSFGTPGDLTMQTPASEESISHEALLLGLLPTTEVGFTVTTETEQVTETSQEQTFVTGSLPASLPALELSFFDADASADGYTIVPLQGDYDCWTCVLDEQGRPVWASEIPCQTHRTRFAPDGSGFVSHYQTSPDNPVQLRSVSFFGDEVSEIPVEDAHHDFAIVDENTTAVLGYTERLVQIGDEELRLVGDTIIEVGPDGSAEVIWDLFDHVAIDPDLPFPESAWREGTFEWSHSNYLTYSADQDAYLITDRSVEAIYKVDRSTGAHLWTLADNLGDFEVHDEQALVEFPHSIEPIDGGLLLFNQGHPLDDDCSEALEIEIDTQAGTASRGWTYETEDCLLTEYLGNAWRLDNGNTLAVFTKLGQMDEVTADGALVQRLNTGMGWWLSYAERVSSLYAR